MPSPFIPTLCRCLDSLLGGGVRRGDVSLFFGSRGVGKTCLGLQTAASNSLLGFETFYIFCQGTFPMARLVQLARGRADIVSSLIHVATPKTFEEQLRFLERFELELHDHPLASLLVVDSIDSLYALQISTHDSSENDRFVFEKNFQLNKHLGMIRNVSRAGNVSALVTCGTRSSSGSVSEEPVSARLMEYWSDNLVEMRKGRSGGFFRPLKLGGKRQNLEAGQGLRYKIVEEGIVDATESEGGSGCRSRIS
ncbi:MAG: hypothetical protein JTT11_00325 [Candidatus Brockarchaeota archaeon]|nr:hypothetical protein [Candidatus Brockarchaeota archaeon]